METLSYTIVAESSMVLKTCWIVRVCLEHGTRPYSCIGFSTRKNPRRYGFWKGEKSVISLGSKVKWEDRVFATDFDRASCS